MGFKSNWSLIFERPNRRERERRGKERRRGRGRGREEEDEGEKFKQSQIKVWKLTLIMDSMRFGMDHMEFV